MRGKELPCLQIRVRSVTKALQQPLDVLSRNAKFPQFRGTNYVVQNNALFLLHGDWHRIDLTFVGSSPSADTHVVLPGRSPCLLASGHWFRAGAFFGSSYRSLDRLLTFRGSEGSSDVVLCTI